MSDSFCITVGERENAGWSGALPTKIVDMIRKLHLDTACGANSTGNEEECTGGGDQQSEVPR